MRFVDILIKLLARDVLPLKIDTISKEVEDGLLSQMWESPAFRKHVAERDAKLIWTMAGGEGFEAEPRDKYLMHTGQRVENLLLARNAKKAFERRTKLAQEQKAASESTPA